MTLRDRGWWGVVCLFLVHGLVTGTWVSRIPAIQSRLGLTHAALGLALLGAAVGSLVAIPCTGWLIARRGSRPVAAFSAAGFAASLLLPPIAPNGALLFLALTVYGAMAAANDVSMNAQGVSVEERLRHPTMSRFHAMFSIAGMMGAAFGGLIAARRVTAGAHLTCAAIALIVFVILAAPLLRGDGGSGPQTSAKMRLRHIPASLVLLSIAGFCIFLSEGAMADWTAVYLERSLAAGPGLAAQGYAVFSAGMTVFRLLGDSITARLGWRRTISIAATVAAAGLTLALLAPGPLWALPGFAITGAGFSVIIPNVFAAGGRVRSLPPGAGIATVSGIGYLGFLFGPPAIGLIAQGSTLRVALSLLVALSLTAAALTRWDRILTE